MESPSPTSSRQHIILAGLIINVMDWYDFAVYGKKFPQAFAEGEPSLTWHYPNTIFEPLQIDLPFIDPLRSLWWDMTGRKKSENGGNGTRPYTQGNPNARSPKGS